MKIILLFTCFFTLTACSEHQKRAMAHITQRKLQNSGNLMVAYQFHEGSQLFLDSMEVQNKVFPHDSVWVIYPSENPKKSHLLLP